MTTKIRHLHSSSRFDRTPLSLLTLVKAWLGRVDLITLTEVGNNKRVAALKRLPGWTFTQVEDAAAPGADECAIITRDAALKVLSFAAVKLTDKATSDRGIRKTYALNATVQTTALERLVVSVVHLPAHVEKGDELAGRPLDVAAWKDSVATWAKVLEIARLKGFGIIAAADWNTNFKRAEHRERIDALMPHLKSAWFVGGIPTTGTHGSRLIDDTRTTLGVEAIRLVSARGSSDHTPYLATLAIPAKEKPPVANGIYPDAVRKLITPGANDPAIKPRVAILHVDAGNSFSLFDYFKNRSGGIESHFHVRADGVVEQYRNIYRQADANHLANDFAVSIETQGFGNGTWNDKQLASIKALLTWLNKEAGIPLVKCPRWDGSGVGYHVQFGAPGKWTPVAKSCPGPNRIKQFNEVLVPWMTKPAAPERPNFDAAADALADAAKELREAEAANGKTAAAYEARRIRRIVWAARRAIAKFKKQ